MDEEIRRFVRRGDKDGNSKIIFLRNPGSKEKSTAIEDLATLYRLRIEETKNELGL